MQFDEANTLELKSWLVKRLEDISDADSDVLADYVLALVKSDDPENEVKANCLENLEDFLRDHTQIFVDDVFKAVQTKSYLPGYVPPPSPRSGPSPPFNAPVGPAFLPHGRPKYLNGAAANGQGNQSRKRSYNDREGSEPTDRRDPHYGRNNNGERNTKQSRRGGPILARGGRQGQNGGFGTSGSYQQHTPNNPTIPTPPPGFPEFDPNNPMAAIMAMQAMGFPSLPGFGQLPGQGPPLGQSSSPTGYPSQSQLLPQVRERCRDYDTKGYCAAGSMCPYEHGSDHIVVPESLAASIEYDPKTASLSPDVFTTPPRTTYEPARSFRGNIRGRARGAPRGNQRGGRGSQNFSPNGTRPGRASFSFQGPNSNPAITSIVVEQIPEEKFSEADVRAFFTEFGPIEDVNMQAYKRLAVVKYKDYASARRAYESPKVIFDNRFVKVYWYKPDAVNEQTAAAVDGTAPAQQKREQEDEEMMDPEEFAQKQAEAQRQHEEKARKLKEAEIAKEDLEKQIRAKAEEHKRLMEKLAAKTGARTGTPTAANGSTTKSMTTAAAESKDTAPAPTPPSSKASAQTEALRAKLAELEAEAETLGLSPEDNSQPFTNSFYGRGRGAYNPYARGGYRGGHNPRGGRGAWRGGAAAGVGAVARLDNRPKSVEVRSMDGSVDFSDGKVEEALRVHLIGIGEFASITPTAPTPSKSSDGHTTFAAAVISFHQRYLAEMFISSSASVPGIGKLALAWVANPPAPAPSTASLTPSTNATAAGVPSSLSADEAARVRQKMPGSESRDAVMSEGVDGPTQQGHTHVVGRDVDYDVADEEDEDRWMR